VLNLYPVTSRTGALRMGLLFLTLRADDRIGHGRHGFELFLTHKLPGELFQGRHVVDAMQEIALAAGGVPDECGIEIVWNKAVELRWRELFSDNGNGPLTIGLNPGGARENRRWNPDGYAILANRLVAEHGARIILLGAPSEVALAGYIASTIPKQSIVNLTGRLNLDELAYIISRLNLLVTNDSGPMHIGAAAGTPLVALFGPGNPVSYLPYTAPERFRILCRDIDCRPCDRDHCARPVCLESILPDEVYEECRKLMGGSPCDGTGNARTAVQGKSE
jgi:ADP-heptose:LPS heptosyltransferase